MAKKEDALDKKLENVEHIKSNLKAKEEEINKIKDDISDAHNQLLKEIENAAQMTKDAAKEHLINLMKDDAQKDAAKYVREIEANAKEEAENGKASIFGYQVRDPERFGIMELDKNNNVIGVEEKPAVPKSNFAITGLYFYPKGVSKKAKEVVPSERGELEITSLNDMYLKEGTLRAELLGGGFTWYDTGTCLLYTSPSPRD